MFLTIVVLCQCLIFTPPVSRSILLGHEQRNSNLKINRKLPFQGNSKEFAQFHAKNILAKNKTHEKTRFMGTPRYQRQKLTESYRFKETQKNLLSFTQRMSWAETNKQTKQKQNTLRKRGLWALLDITSKNLQGIPLIQGYPPYSKGYITGLNIQAHLFNGRSFTICL